MSRMSRQCLDELGIEVIKWPGNSPDLNPIENTFAYMKRLLQDQDCSSRASLIRNFENIWRDLGQDYFRKLCDSMPTRIRMCLEKNGGSIKY